MIPTLKTKWAIRRNAEAVLITQPDTSKEDINDYYYLWVLWMTKTLFPAPLPLTHETKSELTTALLFWSTFISKGLFHLCKEKRQKNYDFSKICLFIYSFIQSFEVEWHRERDREACYLLLYSLKASTVISGGSQNQELNPELPCENKEPIHMDHHLLPPRHISRKLNCNQRENPIPQDLLTWDIDMPNGYWTCGITMLATITIFMSKLPFHRLPRVSDPSNPKFLILKCLSNLISFLQLCLFKGLEQCFSTLMTLFTFGSDYSSLGGREGKAVLNIAVSTWSVSTK